MRTLKGGDWAVRSNSVEWGGHISPLQPCNLHCTLCIYHEICFRSFFFFLLLVSFTLPFFFSPLDSDSTRLDPGTTHTRCFFACRATVIHPGGKMVPNPPPAATTACPVAAYRQFRKNSRQRSLPFLVLLYPNRLSLSPFVFALSFDYVRSFSLDASLPPPRV
jgi:hypothetical protein